MRNKIEYYRLTLKNGLDAIQVDDKNIPIVGVILSDNNMHELITGRIIKENLANGLCDGISYISARLLEAKEEKTSEDFIISLNIDERDLFRQEIDKIDENLKTENYINSSYGLGEKMTRRLIVKSNRKDLMNR